MRTICATELKLTAERSEVQFDVKLTRWSKFSSILFFRRVCSLVNVCHCRWCLRARAKTKRPTDKTSSCTKASLKSCSSRVIWPLQNQSPSSLSSTSTDFESICFPFSFDFLYLLFSHIHSLISPKVAEIRFFDVGIVLAHDMPFIFNCLCARARSYSIVMMMLWVHVSRSWSSSTSQNEKWRPAKSLVAGRSNERRLNGKAILISWEEII